jgi:hypothetical protein
LGFLCPIEFKKTNHPGPNPAFSMNMHDSPVPWNLLSSNLTVGQLTEGWNLAEWPADPEKERSFIVEVVFAAPFSSIPVVHLGLTGLDTDQRDSPRLKVHADSITASGFQAVITTWSTTRVFAVSLQWLAIGP